MKFDNTHDVPVYMKPTVELLHMACESILAASQGEVEVQTTPIDAWVEGNSNFMN